MKFSSNVGDLRRSFMAPVLFWLYGIRPFRRFCIRLACRLEGNDFYSATLREIIVCYHGVKVGAYSYGPCLEPGAFPPGTTVGRYVSIASGVRILNRNHPTDRLSTHPFFYSSKLGVVDEDTITCTSLEIGHDAWIGADALITPGCSRIGIGAVVGAGALVTKNVPDFAVVAGNPARVLRYRFSEPVRDLIRRSEWWEQPVEVCSRVLATMTRKLDDPWEHPLLSRFVEHHEYPAEVGLK